MPENLARQARSVASRSPAERLQRSSGEVRLAFGRVGDRTRLRELYQGGSAKARFPRSERGHAPQAVLLNTTGGMTDGDLLSQHVAWEAGATALVTSQTAERIYRSRAAPAIIRTRLRVEAGAIAVWAPQETILFDAARMDRRNDVEIAPGGRLLACEALVFGRAAMGETVRQGLVMDAWRVRVGDRLAFADCIRLEGDIEDALRRPAIASGAKAVASVLYAGEDGATVRDRIRSGLRDTAVQAACSCLGGVTIARLLAPSGFELRAALNGLIAMLLQSLEAAEILNMPRVWAL